MAMFTHSLIGKTQIYYKRENCNKQVVASRVSTAQFEKKEEILRILLFTPLKPKAHFLFEGFVLRAGAKHIYN